MCIRNRLLFATLALLLLAGANETLAQSPQRDTAAIEAVSRALAAHGAAAAATLDSVGEGTVSLFGPDGTKAAFSFKLLRKGLSKVQRVFVDGSSEVREGSDGARNWRSFHSGKTVIPASGVPLQFIESQTIRSVQRLFNFETQGLAVRDKGTQRNARAVEAEDSQSRKTTYFVDNATSLVSRVEFEIGTAIDAISRKPVTLFDTYEFSDYRTVQGVLTPFRIERYNRGSKVEEMVFTSIRYNSSVADETFRP